MKGFKITITDLDENKVLVDTETSFVVGSYQNEEDGKDKTGCMSFCKTNGKNMICGLLGAIETIFETVRLSEFCKSEMEDTDE